MDIWWEKWNPMVLSVLAAVAGAFLIGPHLLPVEFAQASITFASILIGFLASFWTILFSIRNSRKIRELEKLGHFETLKDFIAAAIRWSLFLVVLELVRCAIPHDFPSGLANRAFGVATIFFVSMSVSTFWRILVILRKLL